MLNETSSSLSFIKISRIVEFKINGNESFSFS